MDILIPWSGGFDSTLLVMNALEQGLRPITIRATIENNKLPNELEARAVDVMMETKYLDHHYLNPSISIRFDVLRSGKLRLHQMPLWITSLLYSVDTNIDEIWLGYKMNDDGLSWKEDIVDIYNRLHESFMHEHVKCPEIKFPLQKFNREAVIYELNSRYPGLSDFCTTCETGNVIDGNCQCSSCSELKWAMGDKFYATHVQNMKALKGGFIDKSSDIFCSHKTELVEIESPQLEMEF